MFQKEKNKKQDNKKQEITFGEIVAKLKEIYKPFWGVMAVIFFFLLVQQAIALISPYIYGKIIDGITQGRPLKEVIGLCLLSLFIFLLNDIVIHYNEDKLEIKKFDFDVKRVVAQKTLDKLLALSIGQHENQNSGVKKSIIDRGQSALTEMASTLIYQIFPMLLQIIVTVTALTIIAPILGAIIIIGLGIYIFISIYSGKIFNQEILNLQELWVSSDKKQSEYIRNASLVKINAKEREVIEDYNSNLENVNQKAKNIWLRFIKFFQLRSAISDITRIAVLIAGVYLVYQKVYTPGFLVIFLSWSSNAFDRISMLGWLQRHLTELYAAIKNYVALLELEPDIKEVENPIIIPDIQGKIEYQNVYFKYPARDEPSEITRHFNKNYFKKEGQTLKNINIVIEAGQKVAIVGHSGAGKSSLVQLLIRAYDPDKGRILIDGYDLKQLSLENYLSQLGIVPQDVVLFDNTLRYNILFGAKGEVSEEKLMKAIKMARVDTFLKDLENGLDTIIGERGVKLSGGERQRVGIARALVKDPAILIFDEATSSLDVENEALIRESIDAAAQGRTTIIIAHRLSTIKDADKIIVLEKGRVIAEGKHNQLLRVCNPYKKMINIQTIMVGNG
ncbi:MAG TPA: ABC transporter ATP-binding protein [Candidatus Pacearchaeota archaeon]|nr:ABC transporter ATP-binding protein [Candidatus Pacearchaeota archaeon]